MMLYSFIFSIAFLAGFPQTALQQSVQMALPDGNGSWNVTIVTSGGITGRGTGDVALSSEGKIACSSEIRCASDFKTLDVQPLVDDMQGVTLPIPAAAMVSQCRDCVMRTITIHRRDSMGVIQIYTASWDDTTRDKLPPEVIRIYDAVTALRNQ